MFYIYRNACSLVHLRKKPIQDPGENKAPREKPDAADVATTQVRSLSLIRRISSHAGHRVGPG